MRKSKDVKIATFDIETDPFSYGDFPLPFCCDFYDGEDHLTFWGDSCVKECFEKCIKNFSGIVYAHNGGKFDFHYLLDLLDYDALDLFVIKNRMVMLKWGETELRDSYALLPIPLKAYDKDVIDYSNFTRDKRDSHRDSIIDYLKRDTESLFTLVTTFIANYGLGLTIRNRAFSQLKKRGFNIPKTDKNYDTPLRPYYFGGRCESFHDGYARQDMRIADINSAYPFAMLQRHPWSTSYSRSLTLPKSGIEQCFIRAVVEGRNCFPLRTKEGLCFPGERAEYHISGWEYFKSLQLGIHRKSDFDIQEVIVPYDTISFKPFIEHFNEAKQKCEKEGDKEGRLFNKLFMNSCYGGFALDPSRYKKYKMTKLGELPHDVENYEHVFDNDYAGITVWETPDPGNEYFNVLTAASITGCVRAMLLEALARHEVLYCDTDSIIFSGPSQLNEGGNLGQWKIEAEGKEFWCAGKKLYTFKKNDGEYKSASKGVSLTPDQIKSVAMGGKIKFNRQAPVYSLKKRFAFLSRDVQNTNKVIRNNPKATTKRKSVK